MGMRDRLIMASKMVIVSASTAVLMHIYQPRFEQHKAIQKDTIVEVVESTDKLWTVMDISGNKPIIWEIDEEPIIEDGFVKFVYGRNYDWVWVHSTNVRIYHQDYR